MADIEIAAAMSFDGAQVVTQVKVITTEVEKAKTSLEALSGVLDDVKKGFSAVTGTLDLFGIKSEGVQKALEKVKAALDVAEGLQSISKLGEGFNKLGTAIQGTTAFKVLDNLATKAATEVQGLFTVAVDETSASFEALKVAIATTGIGLLIVGLGELITYLKKVSDEANISEQNEKNLNDVRVESEKNVTDQKVRLQELLDVASNHNQSLKNRQAAIQGINDIQGKYVGDITLEAVETGKAKGKVDEYIKSLEAKALAEAYHNKLVDLEKQKIDSQNKTLDESLTSWQKLKVGVLQFFNAYAPAASAQITYYKENATESDKLISAQIEALKKSMEADTKAGNLTVDLSHQQEEADNNLANTLDKNLQAELERSKQREYIAKNNAVIAKKSADDITQISINAQKSRISILEDYAAKTKGLNKDVYDNMIQLANEAKSELARMESDFQVQQFKEHDEFLKKLNQRKQAIKEEKVEPTTKKLEAQTGLAGTGTPLKQFDASQDPNSAQSTQQFQQLQKDKKAILDLNQSSFVAQLQQQQEFYKQKKALLVNDSEASAALDKHYLNQKLQVTSNILGQLSDLFGKKTAAGKATAIAEATINTYLAASAALTGIEKLNPFGAAVAIAETAIVIGVGLKNIKSIIDTKVPGQSDSAGSSAISTSSIAAPLTPSPVQTSTTLNQDQINQIGNAASRVYVLDSDIQNNRERDARLNRAARLGG